MKSSLMALAPGVLLSIVLFSTGPVAAQEGKKECLWEPKTGKGEVSTLTLVTESGGKLKVDAPDGCGKYAKYECSQWKGPGGAEAVHFKAFEKKGGQAFEAFAAVEKGAPRLVWSGVTGLSGEYGERQPVEVEDGDGRIHRVGDAILFGHGSYLTRLR